MEKTPNKSGSKITPIRYEDTLDNEVNDCLNIDLEVPVQRLFNIDGDEITPYKNERMEMTPEATPLPYRYNPEQSPVNCMLKNVESPEKPLSLKPDS